MVVDAQKHKKINQYLIFYLIECVILFDYLCKKVERQYILDSGCQKKFFPIYEENPEVLIIPLPLEYIFESSIYTLFENPYSSVSNQTSINSPFSMLLMITNLPSYISSTEKQGFTPFVDQATPGFELGKKDLQSPALPLGHAAKTI